MRRAQGLLISTLTLFMALVVVANSAAAKEGAKTPPAKVAKGKKPTAGAHAVPAGVTVNACGCYRTDAGACFCGDKNGPCACPGDCEPVSCEQKRSKEMQREIAAETKKAQDADKKRQAEEAATASASHPDASAVTVDDTETSDEATDDADKKTDDTAKTDKSATKKDTKKGRKRSVAKP